jgi:hypothetical protein
MERVLRIQMFQQRRLLKHGTGTIFWVESTSKGDMFHEVETEQPESDELLATHL